MVAKINVSDSWGYCYFEPNKLDPGLRMVSTCILFTSADILLERAYQPCVTLHDGNGASLHELYILCVHFLEISEQCEFVSPS